MKVLQAMAGARYGGAEAFFTRLVGAFARAGVDQHVVIRRDADRADLLNDNGITPVQLKFGGPVDVQSRWQLRREIKAYQPDIVLSWMNRATQAVPKGKFMHLGRLGGYYNLKYYQNCDHLIANTRDIAEFIAENGWDSERVHYLPNFVSGVQMPAVDRRELYTPATAPLILGLGRLHKNKGFDVLLRAFARVPDAYLWLAGEGPLRADLEKQAEHLGIKPRVRFLGWREDTPALFAAADVFVCSSRHEPLGNVVIEAWAQGTPVVAMDSLGPGMLIEQGVNGLLVPVDDVVALSHAIKRLTEDSAYCDALRAGGDESYRADYTEETAVRDYLAFFEWLLA